ncbi:MAG TPA: type II toxin-antitoxin system ParD family antitoxin [Alphaproteobacteria bacterium]|jgi:Arc/MetJ-type ribon-helix-helix transcriptional regulator|nr:type II toxin-antitoxin system ParD family antitoxin [Alphaproteobacteria bacterium]
MEIKPTPDQEEFIRQAVAAGRLESSEAAAREAMALWEGRERRRLEILAAVEEAEASLERGEGVSVSVDQLIDDVKRRGRERFSRERKAG